MPDTWKEGTKRVSSTRGRVTAFITPRHSDILGKSPEEAVREIGQFISTFDMLSYRLLSFQIMKSKMTMLTQH